MADYPHELLSRGSTGPHCYMSVPPLLISVSGLEGYLTSLSRQLGYDMNTIKKSVKESATEVMAANKSVNDLKRFLTSSALQRMQEMLDISAPAEQAEADHVFQDLFGASGSEPTEADFFPAMLALSKKLMSDNARLRQALEASTKATEGFIQNQEDIKKQLAELNFRIKSYQTDFHELSMWLGTYDAEQQATRTLPTSTRGGHRVTFDNCELATASDGFLEGAVAQSPLLLAFRRILLRDLVDRVTHTSDMQAREVGSVVAVLKQDISQRATTERVVDLLGARRTSDAQPLAASFAKRLKEIEDSYVRKEDLTTVTKSKGGSVILPVKADNAVVTSLERRVFDKYAELEERVAFFEAEREEFRSIVRSLVALHQQHLVSAPVASVGPSVPPAEASLPPIVGATSAAVQLGELLTTRSSLPGARTDPRSVSDPSGTAASGGFDATGKAIYRVIGAGRSVFATAAVTAPDAASGRDASAKGKTFPPRKAGAGVNTDATLVATPAPPKKQYVGMTQNQMAYAHMVSGELSRDDVKSMPVLPYEPASR